MGVTEWTPAAARLKQPDHVRSVVISNIGVLRRMFDSTEDANAAEADESETGTDEPRAGAGDPERPAPKLRSKLGLFLALVVLTALGEATLRSVRKRRRTA